MNKFYKLQDDVMFCVCLRSFFFKYLSPEPVLLALWRV